MNEVNDKKINVNINDTKLLEILDMELKIYKLRLEVLELEKPYWFQKEEMKNYMKKKEAIENKINSLKFLYNKEMFFLSDFDSKKTIN